MKDFHLRIVTPDGEVYDGEAESLLVHADDGDVEILAGHVDYMASLGTGRTRVKTKAGERIASSSGGFITVSKNQVTLVATTFEYKDEIDIERAKAAKEKADIMLKNAKDDKATLIAKAKLIRAINRIKIAEE